MNTLSSSGNLLGRIVRSLVVWSCLSCLAYAGSTHLAHNESINFSTAGGTSYNAMTLIDWDAPSGDLIQVETWFGNNRVYVDSRHGSILLYVWYTDIHWDACRCAWVASQVEVMYDRMDGYGYVSEYYSDIALSTVAHVSTSIYVNGSFVSHEDVSGSDGYNVTW